MDLASKIFLREKYLGSSPYQIICEIGKLYMTLKTDVNNMIDK